MVQEGEEAGPALMPWVEMTAEQLRTFMREACHAQALIEDRMTAKQREKLERDVFLLENPMPEYPTRCGKCGHTATGWKWEDGRRGWMCVEPSCMNTWEYKPR